MEVWSFLPKRITQKPASHFHYNSLAVLVRHNQAQKCLHITFQKLSMELLPSAKAMGLISSLFDIASSQNVPFHQPQFKQCTCH